METANSGALEAMLKRGELVESTSEMTPDYLRELKHTLLVSGDTELISAPAYYLAARKAPSVNAFMTGIAIIQDELAHAHVAYHILEELGESQEALIFKRDPKAFRYPYAFDVPLKGLTNDQLRQQWLSTVVPFMESIGIRVPAHKEGESYVLDYPFPCTFDAEEKRWDFKDPCSWDAVLKRWRARGPRNAEMVALFQESFAKFQVRA